MGCALHIHSIGFVFWVADRVGRRAQIKIRRACSENVFTCGCAPGWLGELEYYARKSVELSKTESNGCEWQVSRR